ncbi:MAG: DDE-type integrase/transposase/recombinase [Pseudomonadota bacterium]
MCNRRGGSNSTALESPSQALSATISLTCVAVMHSKYLNNVQDHRFIKQTVRPMMGIGAIISTQATVDGIKLADMIRKGQSGHSRPFAIVTTLAA